MTGLDKVYIHINKHIYSRQDVDVCKKICGIRAGIFQKK